MLNQLQNENKDYVGFYEREFYPFSNFSSFRLMWKTVDFDTSEAAYHWEKFPDHPDIQAMIIQARSAHDAYKISEQYKPFRREDWDEVKVSIMLEILQAKVAQHEYVYRKLLETGTRRLVEDSWRDSFWGWGADQSGQNMLGKLWEQVRTEITK